jgi:hypothetical protein
MLPTDGRYRIVVIDAATGRQDRGVGRREVAFAVDGDLVTVRAYDRRVTGSVMRELVVLTAEQTSNKTWELHGEAETWRLQKGCSCGG